MKSEEVGALGLVANYWDRGSLEVALLRDFVAGRVSSSPSSLVV